MSYVAREIGIGCYYNRCREQVSGTVKKGAKMADAHEELHGRAGNLGWLMGLDSDGQAHYGCPDHGPALFNESPLTDFRPRFRQLYRCALVEASPVSATHREGE